MIDIRFSPDLDPDTYIGPLGKVIRELNPKSGLEIGFCWGMSAFAFLESCAGTLLSVDLDDSKRKEGLFKAKYSDRWSILYGRSPDVLKSINWKYQWIYVDGDHTYESAKADLDGVLPLLAKGGVIACDDYGIEKFGVKKAVDEFAKKNGFKITKIEGHTNGAVFLKK